MSARRVGTAKGIMHVPSFALTLRISLLPDVARNQWGKGVVDNTDDTCLPDLDRLTRVLTLHLGASILLEGIETVTCISCRADFCPSFGPKAAALTFFTSNGNRCCQVSDI